MQSVRKIIRKVVGEAFDMPMFSEIQKIKLVDLMVDAENMDSAYYRAQDSMDEPTSKSSHLPLSVYKFGDGTLLLSDGHHRIADIIIQMDDTNKVLNTEVEAEVHELDYEDLDDVPDERFNEWCGFGHWLLDTGDWHL